MNTYSECQWCAGPRCGGPSDRLRYEYAITRSEFRQGACNVNKSRSQLSPDGHHGEYLWPARHVAEFAYCPRLFYLMEVEGVYYPNADTEKGKAVHKRVDEPSALNNGSATKADSSNL